MDTKTEPDEEPLVQDEVSSKKDIPHAQVSHRNKWYMFVIICLIPFNYL